MPMKDTYLSMLRYLSLGNYNTAKIQKPKMLASLLAIVGLVTGCTGVPEGVTPVQPFAVERYLGHWYEIKRLDHSFEEGLTDVSATYSLRDDGGIKVVNRGYDTEKAEWKEAIGKAYFLKDQNTGSLKVSFFGPFYGGYHIAKLDADYQMALVVGPNTDYAWLLSRSEQPSLVQCDQFMQVARNLGISDDQWITVRDCQ